MHRPLSLIALVLVILTGSVAAHHGDEFFVLEDYEVPSILGGHLSGSFDWEKFNGSDEFSAETMVMMTIAPQVAFSIGTSVMDHGDGWKYSSVTPRLHVQLTPPDWEFPLRVSLSLGYQIVDGAAGHANKRVSVVTYEKVTEQVPVTSGTTASPTVIEVPVTTTTTTTTTTTVPSTGGNGTGTGNDNPCDPNVDVDCPPAPPHAGHTGGEPTTVTTTQTTSQTTNQTTTVSSSDPGTTQTKTRVKKVKHVQKVIQDPGLDYSGSIHNHDENLWTGRLIIEGDFGKTKALVNLIGLSPEGAAPAWGYAAGVRRQITHSLGLGVEAIGDFAPDGMHEVIIGGFINPTHHLTVKIGAGFGLTEASSDFSLRTGFTYRF